MTVNEFKAWLEGYLEDNNNPSIDRIKEQADKIVAEVRFDPSRIDPSPYAPFRPTTGTSNA